MRLWQLQALIVMFAAALVLAPMALGPKLPKHMKAACERPLGQMEYEACASFR